jgi:hypothetical protein
MFAKACSSIDFGLAKIPASSACKEHRRCAAFGNTGFKIPLLAVVSIILCKGSIESLKAWRITYLPVSALWHALLDCVVLVFINSSLVLVALLLE